jgi:hypothetical protein
VIPLGDGERYRRVFDEALAAAVALIETEDEAEAAEQVARAIEQADGAGRQALVTAAVVEAARRRREVETDKNRREADQKRRAETERDGRKALEKLFGKRLAGEVKLFSSYTIVRDGAEFVLAVHRDALAEFQAGLLRTTRVRLDEFETVRGYRLGTVLDAGELGHVVNDAAEGVELVRARVAANIERQRQEQAAKAAEMQAGREAARERNEFGITLR